MSASWAPGRESTATVDPTYGQRCVFAGLDSAATAADDDLDVEDDQDALDYLRLVRVEAGKIPHVMVAAPPRYGPQAFPQPEPTASSGPSLSKRQLRRRNWRHWDDEADRDDDQDGRLGGPKRRRGGSGAVELSYDEGGEAEAAEKEVASEEEDGHGHGHGHDYSHGRSIYDSGLGDARGYYQDGAYTAAPDEVDDNQNNQNNSNKSGRSHVDAQFTAAFRDRLLARFAALRTLLHGPASDGGPLDGDTFVGPLSAGPGGGVASRWLQLVQTTEPTTAQVAAFDRVSAFRLLRILQRGLQGGRGGGGGGGRAKREKGRGRGKPYHCRLAMDSRTSRWLWAVLARLPEAGELGYVEVGYIRDVAKEAVLRLAHLSYDMEGQEEEAGEEADGEGGEREEEGEVDEGGQEEQGEQDWADMAMDVESEPEGEAEKVAEAEVRETKPGDERDGEDRGEDDLEQRATLEMVLAVAGVFYGQRDLLAFRSPWPAMPT